MQSGLGLVEPMISNSPFVWCVAAVAVAVGLQFLVGGGGPSFRQSTGEGLHLTRRVQHLFTGLLILALTYTPLSSREFRPLTLALLLACSGLIYYLHRLRLRSESVRSFLLKSYAAILRQKEIDGAVPGAFYFMLGVTGSALAVHICVALEYCEEEPAIQCLRLGIIYLSVGDPVAAIVGSILKRSIASSGKSLNGSTACFLACVLASLVISDDFVQILVGSITATLSERFSWPDDNLWMPLTSTFMLLLMTGQKQIYGLSH